jgi:hypothetical protein
VLVALTAVTPLGAEGVGLLFEDAAALGRVPTLVALAGRVIAGQADGVVGGVLLAGPHRMGGPAVGVPALIGRPITLHQARHLDR